ncbi:MAG: membrane protein insertion efficiency factor YidD [Candidatus Brocadiales bacterium]|nr:membrane protein insertion efficiency factor YidD [Candidatus Brocadiales bacterium]
MKYLIVSRSYLLLAILALQPAALSGQEMLDSLTFDRQSSFLETTDSFYQGRIGAKTIHRCPFNVSCSQYAKVSIKKYGWIKGLALFLDRYFYRENISISKKYPKVYKENRIVYEDTISDSLLHYYRNN